ncbi:hypothetical protein BEP19_05825 [Ammoniphilus oxalaticus]|uniref:AI-2E family transporter n=1 Tax=Ammoniphilus oxalaticus TaxID=66863 RepID=A0A419SKY2_9BACL|nr:hypothetical protein BEP19_05825 [Ammoniphilus oxalaticus]
MKILFALVAILLAVCSLYLIIDLSPRLNWFWRILKALIFPLFISIVIAYLLNPIVHALHRRQVPRGIAVLTIYFTFLLISIVFLMKVIPASIIQFKDFGEHLPDLIRTYQGWLDEIHEHKYDLPDSLRLSIDHALITMEQKTSLFFSSVLNGAGELLSKMIGFLVIPFLVFYLLKDMKVIQKGILLLIPRSHRKEFGKVIAEVDDALGNYVAGQLIVAFVIGGLAYLGYWILGMPYAIILAFIIMVTNIIPYFGPLIGAIPSIFVALTISVKMTIWVLVINLIIQIVEGNILSPLIMGKKLRLHPILIILALLVGGEVGGLVGLIFAVPIVAVSRVVFNHAVARLVKH